MREIRPFGSEGGAKLPSSLPPITKGYATALKSLFLKWCHRYALLKGSSVQKCELTSILPTDFNFAPFEIVIQSRSPFDQDCWIHPAEVKFADHGTPGSEFGVDLVMIGG